MQTDTLTDVALERQLLGAAIRSATAREGLRFLASGDFTLQTHAAIWRAMQRRVERGDPVDPYSVWTDVRALESEVRENLFEYLVDTCSLDNATILDAHADYHGRQLRELTQRRLALRLTDETERAIRSGASLTEVRRLAAEYLASLESLEQGATPHVSDVLEAAEQRWSEQTDYVRWPLLDLTEATDGGIRPGLFAVIGGLAGSGKTLFGLQCARYAAMSGTPSLYFSLEMDERDCAQRLLAQHLGCRPREVASHPGYAEARSELGGYPLWLWGKPVALSIAEIERECHALCSRYGLRFVVVDYAGLVESPGRGVERAEDVARGFQRLFRSSGMAGLVLTQVTRQVDGSVVSRYSRDLENHAQCAYYLERQRDKSPCLDRLEVVKLQNAKNRYGYATGHELLCGWLESEVRYVDLAPEDARRATTF